MAQLIAAFNALQYDPTQSAGQLPIGKHVVIAESSEIKPTQQNNGGYLQFNLKIVEGQAAGASGAFRLNLYNSSQQAVEIANKQMSALCHAVGVFQVTDSSQLHNIPFMVEVGPQKDNPQYTEIKKIFDRNGNEPGKAGQPQQQQAAQQQPQSNPVGGFGSQAPVQQQQPQQPAQNGAAWGQQQPQQPSGAPAWGNQQQQPQNAPQGQQQQPAWGGQAGGAAPWGQPR